MTISNYDDVIDSRDVIERIEELNSELEDYQADCEDAETDEEAVEAADALDGWLDDNKAEMKALEELQSEAESYSEDWQHGATLIRDSYFTEYAEELCKEIGEIPSELPWYIENHIDWEGVAREIRMDYTSVEFDGVTYWVR